MNRRRPTSRTLVSLFALLVLLPVASTSAWSAPAADVPPSAGAPRAEIRVLRSDGEGVLFRLVVPAPAFDTIRIGGVPYVSPEVGGMGRIRFAGRPILPVFGKGIAIPPGRTARVTARILSTESHEDFLAAPAPTDTMLADSLGPAILLQPDREFYRGGALWPGTLAALDEPVMLRHQRVVPLRVCPFQYDPSRRSLAVYREMEVRVDFLAPDRGFGIGPEIRSEASPEPAFEEVYRGAVLNYEEGRAFRFREIGAREPAALVPAASGPEWKLTIRKTGLYRVPFSTLSSKGFPAGTPVSQVRVYEKSYLEGASSPFQEREIPVEVLDRGEAGVFDSDDDIVLYGLAFKDRFRPAGSDARYTDAHVYWIGISPTGGTRPERRRGFRSYAAPATPASFWQLDRYEESHEYTIYPQSSAGETIPQTDGYFWAPPGGTWLSQNNNSGEFAFRRYPFSARDPDRTRPVRVRSRFMGLFVTTREHYASVGLGRGTGVDDTVLVSRRLFFDKSEFVYDSGLSVPGTRIVEGPNAFLALGEGNPDPLRPGQYLPFNSGFDWFEIGYARRYAARDGLLAFTTDRATGEVELRVTRFPSADLLVLDVTDSLRAAVYPVSAASDTAARVEPAGDGTFTLRLQESVGAPRKFVAAAVGSIPLLPEEDLEADTPSSLAEDDGSDYLMVVADAFADALLPLAAHRERADLPEPHRVKVARVSDVFDEFNGGDKSPVAIRAFFRYAFRTWNRSPVFALLAGDGSEDYKGYLNLVPGSGYPGRSNPDWVPTMTLYGFTAGDRGQKELNASDTWFIAALPFGENSISSPPDMHIGRIPAGSAQQLSDVVAKIIAYESFGNGDAWRNRSLFIADDRYSSGISFTSPYCRNDGELDFERLSADPESLGRPPYNTPGFRYNIHPVIRTQGGHRSFGIQNFFLSAFLDTVPALNRDTGDPLGDCPGLDGFREAGEFTSGEVRPVLLSLLSQGHLLVNYQGHANRAQFAHENLIVHQPLLGRRDLDEVRNFGRPFVFLGYACHINDFTRFDEFAREADANGEELLFPRDRGAVASFASTGFELLSTNPVINYYTVRGLFRTQGVNEGTGRPRVLLMEAIDAGLVEMYFAETQPPDHRYTLLTYTLLGDPALRVDLVPPEFEVSVDGQPVPTGASIRATSADDSVTIRALVADDVDVRSLSIQDGPTAVDSSGFVLELPEPGTLAGNRVWTLTYRTRLRADTYTISIRARDWAERLYSFDLKADLTALYYVVTRAGKVPIGEGDNVPSAAQFEVVVESPVPLPGPALAVLLDGTRAEFEASPLDTTGRKWSLSGFWNLPNGDHAIAAQVTHREDPSVLRSRGFRVANEQGDIAIEESYFYPSPLRDQDHGFLVYRLTNEAERAEIRIYSVAGRLVRTLPGTGAFQNAVDWDLRDQAGDPVANGNYVYRLSVRSADGEKDAATGSFAVSR